MNGSRQKFGACLGCFAICLGANWGGQAAQLTSFQAGDGGWHMGTLASGNIDADSQQELVVPYRNVSGHWFVDAYDLNGTRIPGFPYASGPEEMNVSPTLIDLDGDGRDEIIVTRANSVVALRGNGTVFWSSVVNSANYIPDGGYQTITNGFYWSPGDQFISNLPSNAEFSSQVSSPIVADIDGDGRREVLTAWKIKPDPDLRAQDFNPFVNDIFGFAEWGTVGEAWSGGVVFMNAATGQKQFVYHIHQLVEAGLAIGKADLDGPLETYVLNDSDSIACFDRTKPHGLWGKGMLHKQFGKNQRLMSGSYQIGIDVHTADIDGDGLDEVLVAGSDQSTTLRPHETVLDDDGTILWRKWRSVISTANNSGWMNNATMLAVNPDHDNRADMFSWTHSGELRFLTWNGVEFVPRTGWPKDFSPLFPCPPVVGDVDGDGAEDIVVGTYNPSQPGADGSLYVFNLAGTVKQNISVPGGVKHIPTLADVNNDGSVDVVFRSNAGRVYAYNFGNGRTNTISWATHRGNKFRDGNYRVSLYPAGTPLITGKKSFFGRTEFGWGATGATSYQVFRADHASGPFTLVAALPGTATNYTDTKLKSGWQYFYELAAVYPTGAVRSAPFAIVPLLNNNLVKNGDFEENDNSHWDKWFTGEIEDLNMVGTTNDSCRGKKSMRINLQNKGNNSSISQFNQYGIPDGTIYVKPGALYSFGGFFKSLGLTQPSQHWLEWNSGKTGNNTNNRPGLPYPNYFTPEFSVGTAGTPWTYANRVFTMPEGFPNVELRHRFTVQNAVSGSMCIDDVFFRELPAPNSTNWIPLIPFGSTWRYATETPASLWFLGNFDDITWPVGTAKFGVGSGPANVVTPLPWRKPTYYFRKTFTVPNREFDELLLGATCTINHGSSGSPLRIWINGKEVLASSIDTATGQGNEIRYFDLAPFLDMLVPGVANTIAVALENTWVEGWDDVAFDINLRAMSSQPVKATIKTVVKETAGVKVAIEAPSGTAWRLESRDGLAANNWQTVQAFTSTGLTPQWVWDTGQNGRAHPNAIGTRFYRIVPN